MKRYWSVYLVLSWFMFMIFSTAASVIANLGFKIVTGAVPDAGLLASSKSIIANLIALFFWWIINHFYLKTKIGYGAHGKFSDWLLFLPILIVIIGDSTLNPSYQLAPLKIITAIILAFSVGLLEEYVFRGLLVNYLFKNFNFSSWLTATLSAVLFALAHLVNAIGGNVDTTIAQMVGALGIGFFFAVVYLVTNNLWIVVLGHTAIDAFDQVAFGTLSNTAGTSMLTGVIYFAVFIIGGSIILATMPVRIDRPALFFNNNQKINYNREVQVADVKQTINPVKSVIAILLPLIELWLGAVIVAHVHTQLLKVTVVVVLGLIAMILAIWMYRDVLARDWQIFRQRIWLHILYAIGGVAVATGILMLVRFGLKTIGLTAVGTTADVLSIKTAGVALLGSVTVIMAPFTEEIVFRHVLFYQFKKRGILTIIMFIVSAIAFGLVHWNNFQGNIIQMIPYMFVGAWFALIYYWSKDIWQNILTHLIFNSLAFIAALFMFIVAIIQH